MSDVSLQVHEDTAPALETVDVSSTLSSEQSAPLQQSNGIKGGGGHHHHHHSDSVRRHSQRNKRKSLRRGESMDRGGGEGDKRYTGATAKDIPEESEVQRTGSRTSGESSKIEPIPPPPPPPHEIENPFTNPDGRPPDVRPKNSALLDVGNNYANQSGIGSDLPDVHHAGLRPNLSCPNWLAQS